MSKWYRFAHMDKNYVTEGDRVVKGQLIGTIGNGNKWYQKGVINRALRWIVKMSAHLHYDISRKAITQEYIMGWSKNQVKEQYVNPYEDAKDEGYSFDDISEFDHLGWDWLDDIGNGNRHPGVDINGKGAGDSDFGNPIFSPISGVVTYEIRTWRANGSWGNIICIRKDDEKCNHKCPEHC